MKQKLAATAGIVVLLALLVIGPSANSNYLLSTVSQSVRLVPIYEVDTTEKKLAISFDASWGAENTPKILDLLDQYKVKATFFLVDIWLNDYPEMAREIAQRGHEISLHSVSHPHFPQLSADEMTAELQQNYQTIKSITGQEAVLFRPPFGDYNNQVLETASALGFQTIQWSIDSLDWKDLSAAEIAERVLKDIGPGDIVLFHNNGKHTAEALPTILSALVERQLQVVPVSELLLPGDWYIDYNGVQRCK